MMSQPLPTVEQIDLDNPGRFDRLILLLALDHEMTVTDENGLNALSDKELSSVEDWLYYRHLAASDNIIRKKRLEQPAISIGILGLRKEVSG